MSPESPVAIALLEQLTRELADRYPDDMCEGPGRFTPADVIAPRTVFVVAWFGSDAVGCGALRQFAGAPETTAEIKRMFVLPSARGKGIGREILRELEAHARHLGYARVVLETGVRQPEAVALYEKEGFRPIAKYPPYNTSALSLCFGKELS